MVKEIINLSDTQDHPAATRAFYDRYRKRIAGIKSTGQRNRILSDMSEDFEKQLRRNPYLRDDLARAYESLKIQCQGV